MATLDQGYWSGVKGSFIDIEAKSNDVLITGFGVDLRGSGSFSLFHRSGSGSGKTSSSTGWTQVGNAVTASGSYSHPIPGGILVPAGTKHAFHVYHTGEIEHNPGGGYPSWQYFDGNCKSILINCLGINLSTHMNDLLSLTTIISWT